ncbi:Trimeric GatFAB AmidoTransferase(AdT) complex subunit [Komagataella phaffii CBS 7435]|nr:Trimeric GatFAB AmidoTransferase(AdT) complex subunit [Komagataella phaffii CBS 7435]CCA40432.1 Trimeric GatFAB AmidoTransferase(AdT) complex subunit [Komagataella phaffii CBS 7435]
MSLELRYYKQTLVGLCKRNSEISPHQERSLNLQIFCSLFMLRKLVCGLEIHTQLKTGQKLFSLSSTEASKPNTNISFFDIGLPGSQPTLNQACLLTALKACVSLNSNINSVSTFDRKHYFYPDQPNGYQITQYYRPISSGGFLKLSKRFDEIDEDEKLVRIHHIQIEQDTGKSLYKDLSDKSLVDYNRSNMPLIEVVTEPDLNSVKQVKAFLRKYLQLMKTMDVSTGQLEAGAMRVDVNVSVDDGERVEIKNMTSTSAIVNAIRYEFKRQTKSIDKGNPIKTKETRGWDGNKTFRLRDKESSVDYRYMPDPELPPVVLDVNDIVTRIKKMTITTPEEQLAQLMSPPYNIKLRDARILLNDRNLLGYYYALFSRTSAKNIPSKYPINWCCHEFLGYLAKNNIDFSEDLFPVHQLADLIDCIFREQVTNNNAKILFEHLLANPAENEGPIIDLITKYELGEVDVTNDSELLAQVDSIIDDVLDTYPAIVKELQEGNKPGSINYLLGQCMRTSAGRIKSKVFESRLKEKIHIIK